MESSGRLVAVPIFAGALALIAAAALFSRLRRYRASLVAFSTGLLLVPVSMLTVIFGAPGIMKTWTAWILAALAIAFVCALAAIGYVVGRMTASQIVVAENVTLGPKWISLKPRSHLRVRRRRQEILISFPSGGTMGFTNWGIGLPGGSIAHPEVKLIDETGVPHPLDAPSYSSSYHSTSRGFSSTALPKDRTYVAVEVRSDSPFVAPFIVWRCADGK